MIGNDIIDLRFTAVHSKWQHPRFLDKLFTDQEQELIKRSSNTFTTIWELWAAKESAYKAYIQNHPGRFYNPKAFSCVGTEVCYKDFKIKVQTSIHHGYIYAETCSNKNILRNIIKVSSQARKQGDTLKRSVLNELSRIFNIDIQSLRIASDDSGVPKLYQAHSQLDVDLSLTHHGSYAAYTLAY